MLLQSSGLGPLTTNTVLFAWPVNWSATDANVDSPEEHQEVYVDVLKSTLGAGKAIIVQKFLTDYPSNEDRVKVS